MTKYPLHKKKIMSFFLSELLFSIFFILYLVIILIEPVTEGFISIPLLIAILLGIFLALSGFFYWLSHKIYHGQNFYFTEDSVVFEFSFIVKKKVTLPLNKINMIHVKRNLVDIIVGGSKLCLGSGNASPFQKAEIILYFEKNQAKEREKMFELLSKKAKKGEKIDESDLLTSEQTQMDPIDTKIFKMRRGDYWALSLTSVGFYFSILFFIFIYLIAMSFESFYAQENIFTLQVTLIAIGLIILWFLLMMLINVLVKWLQYFNYTIYREKDQIKIHYGLLNIKSFSIPLDKLHGIRLEQNFIQKLLRRGSVKLYVIGMNDNDSNSNNNQLDIASLFPMGKIEQLNKIKDDLLPEFTSSAKVPQRCSSKSKRHFFIFPNINTVLFALPFLVGLTLLTNNFILFFLFIFVMVLINIDWYLQYKHSSYLIDQGFSEITCGGLNQAMIHCRTKSIQEIEIRAGKMRRRDHVSSIRLFIRGGIKRVKVRNIYEEKSDCYN